MYPIFWRAASSAVVSAAEADLPASTSADANLPSIFKHPSCANGSSHKPSKDTDILHSNNWSGRRCHCLQEQITQELEHIQQKWDTFYPQADLSEVETSVSWVAVEWLARYDHKPSPN